MQRSDAPPPPLLVPTEDRDARLARKDRLRALDALLLMVEQHNWEVEPWRPAAPEHLRWASLLGVPVDVPARPDQPVTGGDLHAAILRRQNGLMRPVYVVHRGRVARVRYSKEGNEVYSPEYRDDLRAIA